MCSNESTNMAVVWVLEGGGGCPRDVNFGQPSEDGVSVSIQPVKRCKINKAELLKKSCIESLPHLL